MPNLPSISSIVISRCLLNLREVAVAHGSSDEVSYWYFSSYYMVTYIMQSHMSSSLDFASNPEPSDSVQPSSQGKKSGHSVPSNLPGGRLMVI